MRVQVISVTIHVAMPSGTPAKKIRSGSQALCCRFLSCIKELKVSLIKRMFASRSTIQQVSLVRSMVGRKTTNHHLSQRCFVTRLNSGLSRLLGQALALSSLLAWRRKFRPASCGTLGTLGGTGEHSSCSNPFGHSLPNNSFKPTPLCGAA